MKPWVAILEALASALVRPFRFPKPAKSPRPDVPPNKVPLAIVKYAEREAWKGIREVGRNRGEGIAKYWDATTYQNGYLNREPYCAAFVCWVVREALRDCKIKDTPTFRRPRTARAWGLEEWSFRQDATTSTKRPPYGDIEPGDILVLHASHCAIALSAPDQRGYVKTVEGNTGPTATTGEQSREGDGVYAKERPLHQFRSRIRFTI